MRNTTFMRSPQAIRLIRVPERKSQEQVLKKQCIALWKAFVGENLNDQFVNGIAYGGFLCYIAGLCYLVTIVTEIF